MPDPPNLLEILGRQGVIVDLKCKAASLYIQLRPEDFGMKDLPSRLGIQPGHARLCPRNYLAPILRLQQSARREVEKFAAPAPLLVGQFVPLNSSGQLDASLAGIVAAHQNAVLALAARLPDIRAVMLPEYREWFAGVYDAVAPGTPGIDPKQAWIDGRMVGVEKKMPTTEQDLRGKFSIDVKFYTPDESVRQFVADTVILLRERVIEVTRRSLETVLDPEKGIRQPTIDAIRRLAMTVRSQVIGDDPGLVRIVDLLTQTAELMASRDPSMIPDIAAALSDVATDAESGKENAASRAAKSFGRQGMRAMEI